MNFVVLACQEILPYNKKHYKIRKLCMHIYIYMQFEVDVTTQVWNKVYDSSETSGSGSCNV